jgi:hypothetical protein
MDIKSNLGAPPSNEAITFWSYWNSVKSSINTMKNLTTELKKERWKLMLVRKRAEKANPEIIPRINSELSSLNEKIMESMKLRQAIDKWVPTFMNIEKESTVNTGLGELGDLSVLPLILPVWALAGLGIAGIGALAYIATTGMELIKDFMFQRTVLSNIEKGVYNAEVAKGLIEAGQPAGGFFSNWGMGLGKMGSVMSIGLLLMGGFFVYPYLKK